MASRYWVGGGSSTNWSATGNTNWAATSGGANNQSVPTTTDDVFFDANSGSGASVISANITVQSLNCTGFTGTLTHNTGVTLTINTGTSTSFLLSAAMTYTAATATSVVAFTNTSGTADMTSNGKRLGSLTINGAGGTVRLLDALRVDTATASTITITTGVFNANNFNVTATIVSLSNSNTRTLTMGSGTWTIGLLCPVNTVVWGMATTTGLTFNKNTANIVIQSNSLAGSRSFQGGSQTFNGLTIDSNTALGAITFTNSVAFSSLAVGAGNLLALGASTTLTVTNAFTLAGTLALPISFATLSPGTISTVSIASGASTIDWGMIRDITFSGGGTFTASNSINQGNNSGIAITPPTILDAAGIRSAIGMASANLDTQLSAISAKTANLPSDPADASDIAAAFGTVNGTLATIAGYIDTEVAAIKAKTDNLPNDPADASDINARFDAVDTAIAGIGGGSAPTADENADALLDRADGIETGFTLRQWLRLTGAVQIGRATGLTGSTPKFKDPTGTKTRVSATQSGGDRSAVTLDAS